MQIRVAPQYALNTKRLTEQHLEKNVADTVAPLFLQYTNFLRDLSS